MSITQLKSKVSNKKLSITKKQSNDYGLIATSYHEAAHTIVALANLILVDNVNVVDSQEGNTLYFMYQADSTEHNGVKNILVMSEIKTIYAGLVGERMYYRDICGSQKFPSHLKNGSAIDTNAASKLIRKYKLANSGRDTFQLKQDIKKDVEKFLTQHWEAVKIVAHSLYKKKKLCFSELKYLLIRTENKDFWRDKFKTMKIMYDEKNDLSTKVVMNLISTK